jgi:hypothetical protein
MERLLKRVVVAFGARDDESPLFYRDIGLALPFILAVFIAVSLGLERRFGVGFVACVIVAMVCLQLATKRRALVGSVFIVSAARLGMACVSAFRATTLIAGMTCAVIGLWIASRDTGEYPDLPGSGNESE